MAPVTPSQVYELVAYALCPWVADDEQQPWVEYGVVTAVAQFVRCADAGTTPWPAVVQTMGKEAGVSYSQAAALAVRVLPDLLSHSVFRSQIVHVAPETLAAWFAGWASHAAACWRAGWYPNMKRQATAAELLTGGHSGLEQHFSEALGAARRKQDGRWFSSILHRRSAKIGEPRTGESLPPRRAAALGMAAARPLSSPDLWITAVVELSHAHGLEDRAAELRHVLTTFVASASNLPAPQTEPLKTAHRAAPPSADAATTAGLSVETAQAEEPRPDILSPDLPRTNPAAPYAPSPTEPTEIPLTLSTATNIMTPRPVLTPLHTEHGDPAGPAANRSHAALATRSHHVGPRRHRVRR